MAKRIPIFFLIFVLLIVALACIVPSITTSDEDFVNTAIAQTQTAAPVIPITGPSLTPTKPPSATPFPTFTVVVIGVPQLSVSEDTICRTGPGTNYDRVGVLQAGEVAIAGCIALSVARCDGDGARQRRRAKPGEGDGDRVAQTQGG